MMEIEKITLIYKYFIVLQNGTNQFIHNLYSIEPIN